MDGDRSLSTIPLLARQTRAANWTGRIAAGAVLGALGFAVLAPLWAIAARALTDTEAVGALAQSERVHRIVLFTVEQTTISVLLALAIGVPVALLACWQVPFSRAATAITTATFVLPTMVVAAAWRALGFPQGLVAITTAHAYFNVAIIVRFASDAYARIPRERFEIARAFGATPSSVTRFVILPGIRKALIAGAAMVAAFSATSLGIVAALAEQRQGSIETEILRRAASLDTLPSAAWLGMLQVAMILPIVLFVARHASLAGARNSGVPGPRLGTRGRVFGAVVLGAVIVVWCVPLVQLLRVASWAHLDRIALAVSGGTTLDAVLGSLRAASVAAPLALAAALALVLIHSRVAKLIRGFSLIALGVSPALLGLGMLLTYRLGAIDLRTSSFVISIAQALVALPFCIRLLADAHESIPPDRIAIARTFGCSRAALFRLVEWPAIARTARSAAGFAAVIALGDFSATTFLARPDQTTVPLLIQQSFSRPGTEARAAGTAFACILLGLCAVLFGLAHMRGGIRRSASAPC